MKVKLTENQLRQILDTFVDSNSQVNDMLYWLKRHNQAIEIEVDPSQMTFEPQYDIPV